MKQKKLRSVALVGFAEPSIHWAKDSQADEHWSVNHAWEKGLSRLDRLFEIHPIEQIAWHSREGGGKRDKAHFKWLQEEHPFPIYTYQDYTGENNMDTLGLKVADLLKDGKITAEYYASLVKKYGELLTKPPRFPSSVPFPFDDLHGIFEHLQRNNKPNPIYMTSTLSYMMALAIMEGVERVEIYGVEMASGTEYAYQKAGLEMLVGYAMGQGIDVWFPDNCAMMNAKPYHKGVQMISRQDLEKHKKHYEQQFYSSMNTLNHIKGRLAEAEKAKKSHTVRNKIKLEIVKAQNLAMLCQAGKQVCENLILTIDYDDPLIEMINVFMDGETEAEKLKDKIKGKVS